MKRILLLGRTEVWAHWTVLLAVLFLTVTEGPLRVGLGLLALLLHELGHLLTARGLGYRVRSLELWPLGPRGCPMACGKRSEKERLGHCMKGPSGTSCAHGATGWGL